MKEINEKTNWEQSIFWRQRIADHACSGAISLQRGDKLGNSLSFMIRYTKLGIYDESISVRNLYSLYLISSENLNFKPVVFPTFRNHVEGWALANSMFCFYSPSKNLELLRSIRLRETPLTIQETEMFVEGMCAVGLR